MKKLFIASLILMITFMFTACRPDPEVPQPVTPPPHICSFDSYSGYEKHDGVVCTVYVCECGEKKYRVVDNAVIATPETAQDVFDKLTSDTVVYFDSGDYGALSLRQSKYTSTARTSVDGDDIPIDELAAGTVYRYFRNLENIVLTGAADAVFKDVMTFSTGHNYGTYNSATKTGNKAYDAVREIYINSTPGSYYSYLKMENLVFEGLRFDFSENPDSASKKFIDIIFQLDRTYIHGITFRNCSFKGETVPGGISVSFRSDLSAAPFEDLVIENNSVDGAFQGFYIQNTKNISATGNTISGTKHNAIACQKGCTGNITITGNTISNIGDRALRGADITGGTIVISGNTFENANDGSDVMKFTTLAAGSYRVENNTYGGASLSETSGEDASFVIKVPAIAE